MTRLFIEHPLALPRCVKKKVYFYAYAYFLCIWIFKEMPLQAEYGSPSFTQCHLSFVCADQAKGGVRVNERGRHRASSGAGRR